MNRLWADGADWQVSYPLETQGSGCCEGLVSIEGDGTYCGLDADWMTRGRSLRVPPCQDSSRLRSGRLRPGITRRLDESFANLLEIEPPCTANLESWYIAPLGHAGDSRIGHLQVLRELLRG